MIRNPKMIREFEDEQVRRNPADYHANLKMFEALWEHATILGALPPEDPLEGLEVDLRLAEALNVR
jgi:hypothetical protein